MSSKWNKLIDQSIGGYTLIECIGRGGMAIVYKAYQPMLDRFVAIKFIADHLLDDAETTERTLREARAISRLEHPHILPIYDCGTYDQSPFIVMKYIKGPTLKEYIRQTRPGIKESCEILMQILEALELAHKSGVVHRDLKPSNILMESNGWIYLSDFGIAHSIHEDPTLTSSGMIMGTPEYMAPEQAQGTRADLRSDLYSAGIILYELLTGRLPFHADTPAGILIKQIEEPPPLGESGIPSPLQHILGKALAKKPEDRFVSASDFRVAITAAMRTPTSATIHLPLQVQKRHWPAFLLLGMLLLTATGLFLSQNTAANQQASVVKPFAPTTVVHPVQPEPKDVRVEAAPKKANPQQKATPISSSEQPPEPAEIESPELKSVLLKALSNRVLQGRVIAAGDSQIEIETKAPIQAGMAGIVVSRESKKPLARIRVTQAEGSIGVATIVKGERNSMLLHDAVVILFPHEPGVRKQPYRLPAKARLEPID